MSLVRWFAVEGLSVATGRRRGLVVGVLDETGQQKRGSATCGVKHQYMECGGRMENGINTVHLSYVRQALAAAADPCSVPARLQGLHDRAEVW